MQDEHHRDKEARIRLPGIDIGKSPANRAYLAGAGVSMPSGLPGASDFVAEIIDQVVENPTRADALRAFVADAGLRMETILDWLQEVCDPELSVIEVLLGAQPTHLHHFLAREAIDGASLLTVNFDELLEEAVDMVSDRSPLTVDAHEPSDVPADATPVIKLHGSTLCYTPEGMVRGGLPHASFTRIGRRNPAFDLNAAAMRELRERTKDRHLIVVGYSGSDDFDVMPALLALDCPVTWLDHDEKDPRPRVVVRSGRQVTSALPDVFAKLSDFGDRLTLMVGNATRCLAAMTGRPVKEDKRSHDWQRRLQRWAEQLDDREPSGMAFAGLLYENDERWDRAGECFERSVAGAELWPASRRAYSLAQTEFFDPTPDAPDLIDEAVAKCAEEDDRLWWSQSLTLRARWNLVRGGRDFESADADLHRALEAAPNDTVRAGVLEWLGRSAMWQRRLDDAVAYLREAIELQTGDNDLQMDANFALGMAFLESCQADQAREHFALSVRTAGALNQRRRSAIAEAGIALVDWAVGDLEEAIRGFERLIDTTDPELIEDDRAEIGMALANVIAEANWRDGNGPSAAAVECASQVIGTWTPASDASLPRLLAGLVVLLASPDDRNALERIEASLRPLSTADTYARCLHWASRDAIVEEPGSPPDGVEWLDVLSMRTLCRFAAQAGAPRARARLFPICRSHALELGDGELADLLARAPRDPGSE